MKKNPVVLIGGNHYNGLGLVRAFAKFQVPAYAIIIGKNAKKGFTAQSKHWKKVFCVIDEEQIPECLNLILKKCSLKPVIIAWSDSAAAFIDKHYEELKADFFLPSINHEGGRIFDMMDKKNQLEFANRCGLDTAKTWKMSLPCTVLPDDIVFPVIVKPVCSAEGEKKDIKKISNEGELLDYLDVLCHKGYLNILIQEYLIFTEEYDILGSVNRSMSSAVITKKVRNWPNVGGSTSYSFTTDDETLKRISQKLISELMSMNYCGLFDVDLFSVGNKIYFNEINWRNSALGYVANNSSVYYQVNWYASVLGKKVKNEVYYPKSCGKYSMNEMMDFHHFLNGDMTFIAWLRDLRRCTGFAYKDNHDMRPFFYKLMWPLLKRL